MLFSLLPVAAFAAEETTPGPTETTVPPEVEAYGFVWEAQQANAQLGQSEYHAGSDWMGETMWVALKEGATKDQNLWFEVTVGKDTWGCAATTDGTKNMFAFSFLNRGSQWEKHPNINDETFDYTGANVTHATKYLKDKSDVTSVTLKVYKTETLFTNENNTITDNDTLIKELTVAIDANKDTLEVVKDTPTGPEAGALVVTATKETDVLSRTVASIQSDIKAEADKTDATKIAVTGTSKYVSGWTQFSSVPEQRNGHYIALDFATSAGGTIAITSPTEKDEEGNPITKTITTSGTLVTRLENEPTGKFDVTVTPAAKEATPVKYTIDMSGITKEEKPTLPKATLQYTSVADKSIVSDCAPDTMWVTFEQPLLQGTNLWFVITNNKNEYVYELGAISGSATTKFAWSFQNKAQFEKWAKDGGNDVALGTTPGATYTVKGYELDATPTTDTVIGEDAVPFATWTVTVPELAVVKPGETTVKDSLPSSITEEKAAAAKAAAATVKEDTTAGFTLSVAAAAQGAETKAPTDEAVNKAMTDAGITAIAKENQKLVQQPALTVDVKDYKTVGENNILDIDIAAVLNVVVTSKDVADDKIQLPAGGKTANAAVVSSTNLTVNDPIDITVTLPADFMTFPTDTSTATIYVKHAKGTPHYHVATVDKDKKATFTSNDGLSPFSFESKAAVVASNERTGAFYATLQEAVAAAEDGDTIVLQKKLEGDAAKATVTLSADKTLSFKNASGTDESVLTINGKTVTVNSTTAVTETFPKTTGGSNGGGGGGGVSSNVTIDRPTNGKVSVSPTAPSKGATVTITLTPDTGYVVGSVTVTDKDGKAVELTKVSDTKYTFTMPAGKVKVAATFTKAGAPAEGFTDVPADAYYADAVKWAVEKGITNGLTATTFGPNNSCTRGQMVTFLWRAAGSPAATGTNSFSDVASGEYYYNAVLWAVEKGITNGTSATTFSPNATVNRGQTVTFLYRYAGTPAATGESSFTDVAADAFYADAVKWAVAEEITNGTSSTTFSPASNCTRGQIVTFMYRQMAE